MTFRRPANALIYDALEMYWYRKWEINEYPPTISAAVRQVTGYRVVHDDYSGAGVFGWLRRCHPFVDDVCGILQDLEPVHRSPRFKFYFLRDIVAALPPRKACVVCGKPCKGYSRLVIAMDLVDREDDDVLDGDWWKAF